MKMRVFVLKLAVAGLMVLMVLMADSVKGVNLGEL
jgi:hypothetical protein